MGISRYELLTPPFEPIMLVNGLNGPILCLPL